jgi:type IV secretion system protein VirD4
MLYQSIGQLEQQWGREGKRAWYESVTWRSYAAIKDIDTARELAATIGSRGELRRSESQTTVYARGLGARSRSSGRSWSEQSVPLIRPEQIIANMRDDEQIVFYGQSSPLRCGRAPFFRRSEFVDRVATNRFARGAAHARP